MRKFSQNFLSITTNRKRQRIDDKEKKRGLVVAEPICIYLLLVLVLAFASISFSAQSFTAKGNSERIVTIATDRINAKAERIDTLAKVRIENRAERIPDKVA